MTDASSSSRTIDDDRAEAVAAQLVEARRTARPLPALTATLPGLTADDAYEIQRRIVARHVADGETIVGWKLGLDVGGDAGAARRRPAGLRRDPVGFRCGGRRDHRCEPPDRPPHRGRDRSRPAQTAVRDACRATRSSTRSTGSPPPWR